MVSTRDEVDRRRLQYGESCKTNARTLFSDRRELS